jgi:Protein of unknown function (DUF732)
MLYKTALGAATISVALTLVAVSATANADEDSFLDRIHAAGMPLTDEKALTMGNATCTDLGNGIPVSAVLETNNPHVGGGPVLTDAQNWNFLSIAVSELCPEFQPGKIA